MNLKINGINIEVTEALRDYISGKLERIVRHTNQVCFYGYMRRPKRGYYECEMQLMTETPTETAEFEITDTYFRMLEENIKNAPAYYLWSHNRWKRTREEFNEKWEVVDGKVLRKKQKD